MLLVTGSAGFLGDAIIRYASECGIRVVAVWNNKEPADLKLRHVEYVKCNLTNGVEVENLFNSFDISNVIHSAAKLPCADTAISSYIDANSTATMRLAEQASRVGVEKFLFMSTTSVYPNGKNATRYLRETDEVEPSAPYEWSKAIAEKGLQSLSQGQDTKFMSLRLGGIHGPARKSGVIYQFIKRIYNDEALLIANASAEFQCLFIEDAVGYVFSLLDIELSEKYKCFNLASNTFPNLVELANILMILLNKKVAVSCGTDSTQVAIMDTQLIRKSCPEINCDTLKSLQCIVNHYVSNEA